MTFFLALLNVGGAVWNGYSYGQNGSAVNLAVMVLNIVVAMLLFVVAAAE